MNSPPNFIITNLILFYALIFAVNVLRSAYVKSSILIYISCKY